MPGMNAQTGRWIGGRDHLRQSMRDILTTPIGTRVMRRAYGSRLFDLVDAPVNRRTLAAIYQASAGALETWEPRLVLERVQVTTVSPGSVALVASGRTSAGAASATAEVAR